MGGLPYGDIIVIGAIAAFILLRYRAMLGERSGRDADAAPRVAQEYERVIQLPEREKASGPAVVLPLKDYGNANAALEKMRNLDKQFSPEEFLEGARAAFEMALQAFNEADRDTLNMLLGADIYAEFDRSLAERSAAGHTQQNTLLAILEASISDAQVDGAKGRITVRFLSEQVRLVRNAAGDIIEGDPAQQEAVEDHWVFERVLNTNDPAWKIIET